MGKYIQQHKLYFIVCLALFVQSCTDDSKELFDQGIAKSSNRDYKGAILDFNKAIAVNPSCYFCYYERGMAKFNLKDYEGAINDMNLELKNNPSKSPNNAPIFFARARAKAMLGDLHGAIWDYDTTILVNKNFPPIVFAYRGATKHMIGDRYGAKKDMDRADSLGYVPAIH
jgi:tetratricopeptide (TPR) repeat protein